MACQRKRQPIPFLPPDAERAELITHAETTDKSVDRIRADALQGYRADNERALDEAADDLAGGLARAVARRPVTTEKIMVRRDGSVLLDDSEIVGHVFGEPRDWSFALADYRIPARTPSTGWHSKREAAEMCVRAHHETPPRRTEQQ